MPKKKYFDALLPYKAEAADKISLDLTWRRLDGKKASTIDLYNRVDLKNPAAWDEIFSWYREYTEKFITFFKPIIKKL
jgi:hypothetical protein